MYNRSVSKIDSEELDRSSGVFIPDAVLQGYGCKNCVWKSFGQCPHGLDDGDSLPKGYCDEFLNFLMSLANEGDSISAIKEKFMLYVQELQALIDFNDYNRLKQEYDHLIATGAGSDALRQMEMRMNAYKLWWNKLNEGVIKGLGKIVDRESRKNENDINVNHKISLTQIHQLMNKAKNLTSEESKTKELEYND